MAQTPFTGAGTPGSVRPQLAFHEQPGYPDVHIQHHPVLTSSAPHFPAHRMKFAAIFVIGIDFSGDRRAVSEGLITTLNWQRARPGHRIADLRWGLSGRPGRENPGQRFSGGTLPVWTEGVKRNDRRLGGRPVLPVRDEGGHGEGTSPSLNRSQPKRGRGQPLALPW